MGDATPLALPAELPFPITITRLLVTPGTEVRRGDRLLEYSFLSATRARDNAALEKAGKPVPPERRADDMVGSWECPIAGTVERWEPGVRAGTYIDRSKANKPVIKVEQPCTHPVQIHGMCGVCGADITNDDYLSRPAPQASAGPSRYPGSFELAHDALGVTVSTNEAKRLETLSRQQLLESRRLSLIVDLDQTIIHTTVDPTVGEWIAEIEADDKAEAEEKAKEEGKEGKEATEEEGASKPDGSTTPRDERSTTPDVSPPRKREKNPNARALRDVAAFRLADDVPSGYKGRNRPSPRRWYYTKPRPGLTDFLNNMSKLYEMHVYTMGTRTYADEICKVIDPDGKIFGGRILSRDESGSMSSKSLVRLFPTDQSMVVVIDDRADVWGDCPNLVKVVPYDFFVGIGDINGAFLPPTQPVVSKMPAMNKDGTTAAPDTPSTAASSPPPETPPEIPSQEEGLKLQSKLLDQLAEDRPLAKLEEDREREEDEEAAKSEAGGEAQAGDKADGEKSDTPEASQDKDADTKMDGVVETNKTTPNGDASGAKPAPEAATPIHHNYHLRKQLLNPDDYELDRVAGILTEIHTNYYKAYDERPPNSTGMPLQCDTPLLIQEIKDEVLAGCTIAFTGVIPRNVVPEKSEIWQLAESFGAICVNDLSEKVTHLVTAAMGTEKMHKGAKLAQKTGMYIVWLPWLQQSIALWKREPEVGFMAHPAPLTEPLASRGASVDADGDTEMEDADRSADTLDENTDDIPLDELAEFNTAWDDEAQAEFDKFLEEDSDQDDEEEDKDKEDKDDKDDDKKGNGMDSDDDSGSDDEELQRRRRMRAGTPSVWSRAATPGPSILSRAGTPGPSGEPKHVRYADEENLPLEDVREPQPGDIPSFPPRKKPRLLVAPSPDDDVPEDHKMVYNANQPAWAGGMGEGAEAKAGAEVPASQESNASHASDAPSTAPTETDDEDDEFARMLQDSLADE